MPATVQPPSGSREDADLDRTAGGGTPVDRDLASGGDERGRSGGWFGPLTPLRVVALVLAFAFLAGAVGWAVGQRDDDPLSSTDVGFMQDMGFHHSQAVEMSIMLLDKDDLDPALRAFAVEILVTQQHERGLFNATLDRFGHDSDPGAEVMGWMGRPLPRDEMTGLATEEQLEALRVAEGKEAAALWIALMTEHHLAGLHMADHEARHGSDTTTRNIARSMVKVQRGEVLDLDRFRRRVGLPIPDGFGDPRQDQRLNPLSLGEE